jgi:hypothetical protein
MGCTSSRDLSDEEITLTKTEDQLKFSCTRASKHDMVFRKYAVLGRLSKCHFHDAADKLKIITTKQASLDQVEEFFSQFMTHDQYHLRLLLILGLLLGLEDVKVKAKLLFEMYDVECTHTLPAVKVTKMIQEVFRVAVHLLPKLSLKPTMTKEVSYIENLKLTQLKVVEALAKLILGSAVEVQQSKFVEAFTTNDILKTLLVSDGFRAYCHKLYKTATSPWYLKPKTQAQPHDTLKTAEGQFQQTKEAKQSDPEVKPAVTTTIAKIS